ncbi:hypothetical protein ACOMHN_052332 [Nucella lapillus]
MEMSSNHHRYLQVSIRERRDNTSSLSWKCHRITIVIFKTIPSGDQTHAPHNTLGATDVNLYPKKVNILWRKAGRKGQEAVKPYGRLRANHPVVLEPAEQSVVWNGTEGLRKVQDGNETCTYGTTIKTKDTMRRSNGLPLLLLLFCIALPTTHCSTFFQYCMWFRGSCELSCGPNTFPLYGVSWCSTRGTRCCVRLFSPPLDTTTTTKATTTTITTTPTTTSTTTTTTTTPVPLPGCGIKGIGGILSGRIIGGELAGKCEFPWMVHIARKPSGSDPCGATLIDQRHIVTAAHCFSRLGDYIPPITIGEYSRNQKYRPYEKLTTSDYVPIIHPQYDPQNFFNDIAILKLRTPIDYRRYRCVQPLCLPAKGTSFPPGTSCIAAGWGVTEPVYNILKPPVSQILRKATLPIVDKALCQARFGFFFNASVEICAGQLDGSRDTCDGDSGGPLMCQSGSGSEYYLAGIVSSGVRCAQPKNPAIYSDVTQFLSWIHEVMGSG